MLQCASDKSLYLNLTANGNGYATFHTTPTPIYFSLQDEATGSYAISFGNSDNPQYLGIERWNVQAKAQANTYWVIENADLEEETIRLWQTEYTNSNDGGHYLGFDNQTEGEQLYSDKVVGNKCATWIISKIEQSAFCDVTYIIKDENKEEVKRTTIQCLSGSPYPTIPSDEIPNFVTIDYSSLENETVPEDSSVEVELTSTSSLPFTTSKSSEDAVWYTMDIHSNEGNYVFSTADNSNVLQTKILGRGDLFAYTLGVADEADQWCFVGDQWKGFSIYNKKEKKHFYLEDGNIRLSDNTEEQQQLFRASSPTGTGQSIENGFALEIKQNPGNFINHQNHKLSTWSSPDAGSTFRAFPVVLENDDIIETLSTAIEDAIAKYGENFPKKNDVDVENVFWPSEFKSLKWNQVETVNSIPFEGLDDIRDLIPNARQAVESENQDDMITALAYLSNYKYIVGKYGSICDVVYQIGEKDITNINHGTIFMPFSATLPQGISLLECTGKDGNVLELRPTSDQSFVANKAYIVGIDDESVRGETYQFIGYGNEQGEQINNESLLVGTHTDQQAPRDSYVLQNLEPGFGFYRVDSDDILVPAHKCYLRLNGIQTVKYLLFPNGSITSIDTYDATNEQSETYDLSGRRVIPTAKGLYIIDGKKVLVK